MLALELHANVPCISDISNRSSWLQLNLKNQSVTSKAQSFPLPSKDHFIQRILDMLGPEPTNTLLTSKSPLLNHLHCIHRRHMYSVQLSEIFKTFALWLCFGMQLLFLIFKFVYISNVSNRISVLSYHLDLSIQKAVPGLSFLHICRWKIHKSCLLKAIRQSHCFVWICLNHGIHSLASHVICGTTDEFSAAK